MMKRVFLTGLVCATLTAPAFADENIEFPAGRPNFPFQRSYPAAQAIVIPPYRHVFPVRIYTTPQQQPYYNVPPYAVVSPY